jgi:heptosyltransferase-2
MKPDPKILVIRFSSLGDIILTTPVYRNLKESWPESTTVAAVKAQYAGVLEGNPSVDRIIELPEGGSLFDLVSRIRKERFDIVLDLHANLRSRVISALSGAPVKIRYRKAALERRMFVSNRVKRPELERHTVDRYLDTLKELELTPRKFVPEIFPQGDRKSPNFRILVVQTAFLGDAVLTTPMFSVLRTAYPSAKIAVLCTPAIRDIFSDNTNIDEILVMDKKGKDRGPAAIWKWAGRLRGQFDVAVLPHRSFRSALLVWLAGIPKRIGFENSQGRMFLTDAVSFDWKTHDSERNLKLLESLGIHPSRPKIEVPVKKEFDFDQFLKDQGIAPGTPLVGMNPGSVWKTKRWIPEHFAKVADELIERTGCRVILFGAPADAEAVRAVTAAMKRQALDLCAKTDLKTLTLLISRCSLFVTNDSGPMHLATAAHIPVVAIFGPTTRELGFFPYGEKNTVIEQDLPCRPCSLHGGNRCPLEHFRCMRDISPERVLEACWKFFPPRTA